MRLREWKARAEAEANKAMASLKGGAMGNLVFIVVAILAVVFVLFLLGVIEVSPIGS